MIDRWDPFRPVEWAVITPVLSIVHALQGNYRTDVIHCGCRCCDSVMIADDASGRGPDKDVSRDELVACYQKWMQNLENNEIGSFQNIHSFRIRTVVVKVKKLHIEKVDVNSTVVDVYLKPP